MIIDFPSKKAIAINTEIDLCQLQEVLIEQYDAYHRLFELLDSLEEKIDSLETAYKERLEKYRAMVPEVPEELEWIDE
jgi:hypothetical protein